MIAALRNGVFKKLAGLYTLNTLLEWVASVALMVVVYSATKSAAVTAAMLVCKQVIPGLLVPLLGRPIDQADLRGVIATAWSVSAVSLLVVGILGYGAWLFPLAVAAGLAASVARTAIRAAVARGVEGDELRGANATLNLILGVAVPVAPGIAAFVIHVQGATTALLASALAISLLVPLALALPRLDPRPAPTEAEAGDLQPAAPSGSNADIPLLALLLLGAAAVGASAMSEPALLPYSVESLGGGVAAFGLLCTAWGLGVTVGSLAFTRLLHVPMLRVYAGATLLSAVAYLLLSVAPTIEFAAAVAVVGGVGTGMDWVAIVTAVQERAQRGSEAEVVAKLEAFATAAPALGVIAGGLIADLVGPRAAIAAPGFLSLAALLALAALIAARVRVARTPATAFISPSLPGGSA